MLHPATKIGIIRNGMVHLGNDQVADPNTIITDSSLFNNREGRPAALITTPTGKSIVSLLTVPKLAPSHQELIVSAWNAFHAVKNSKDPSTIKEQNDIVKSQKEEIEYLILIVATFAIATISTIIIRKLLSIFIIKYAAKLNADPTNYAFIKNSAGFIIYTSAIIFVFYKIQ